MRSRPLFLSLALVASLALSLPSRAELVNEPVPVVATFTEPGPVEHGLAHLTEPTTGTLTVSPLSDGDQVVFIRGNTALAKRVEAIRDEAIRDEINDAVEEPSPEPSVSHGEVFGSISYYLAPPKVQCDSDGKCMYTEADDSQEEAAPLDDEDARVSARLREREELAQFQPPGWR
jgi:hypothetical protein